MADRLIEVADETARQVARILGPQSAAAMALADVERRRAGGEDACIYERHTRNGNSYVVGPRIVDPDAP